MPAHTHITFATSVCVIIQFSCTYTIHIGTVYTFTQYNIQGLKVEWTGWLNSNLHAHAHENTTVLTRNLCISLDLQAHYFIWVSKLYLSEHNYKTKEMTLDFLHSTPHGSSETKIHTSSEISAWLLFTVYQLKMQQTELLSYTREVYC